MVGKMKVLKQMPIEGIPSSVIPRFQVFQRKWNIPLVGFALWSRLLSCLANFKFSNARLKKYEGFLI